MREAKARRLHLKSKLLAGAAGMAAVTVGGAAIAQPAAPAEAPKWLPWAQVGGGAGKDTAAGKVDLFAPVWQDMDSLVFVNLGMGTQKHADTLLNIGVGYRTKINGDWILGVSGGFDSTQTDTGGTFNQWSAGIEAMSEDWDARFNAYWAADKNPKAIAGQYGLFIIGTTIGILQGQSSAYSGFDGEIGYRVFHTASTDVRLFAGGFSFKPDHFTTTMPSGAVFDDNLKDIEGWKARAEVNVFDLDLIGSQSRLQISGEVAHDDARGTTSFFGAALRIPLDSGSGEGGQALDELDRRMADPRRRQDNVLTQWAYNKPEPVIIYNGTITSEPTNTLYYVDNSAGSGSYDDPTTFKDAVNTRGIHNQFVVVTDFEGAVNTQSAVVLPGDTVVGGGETFTVRGATSGETFTHTFAPGSGTPTLFTSVVGGNVVNLDPNTNLFGMNFGGAFNAAIYGHNVNDVVIGNVTIDGSGGGDYGILLSQDAGSGTVQIYSTTITDVGIDGIHADIDSSAGGVVGLNISFTDGLITGSGDDGIEVQSNATGAPSVATAVLGVHDSTISGSGGANVIMIGTSSAGGGAFQTLVVDPTILSDAEYGVVVSAFTNGGSVSQNVLLQDLTIYDVDTAGIVVTASAQGGGHITQNVTIDNVSVDGGLASIYVSAYGTDYSTVDQTVHMTDVTVTNIYADGISIYAGADAGATVTQLVTMDDVTIHSNWLIDSYTYYGYYGTYTFYYTFGGNPLSITGIAYDGGSVDQTVVADGLTVDGGYSGIFIGAGASGSGSTVTQGVGLYNASVGGIYGDDINIVGQAVFGGAVDQTTILDDVAAYGSFDGNGVHVRGIAVYGGQLHQVLQATGLYTGENWLSGVRADVYAYDYGYLSAYYGPAVAAQYITIADSTIVDGLFHGVSASVEAYGPYAAARQDLAIIDSDVSFNYGYGILGDVFAAGAGSAEQHVTILGSNIDYNGFAYGDGGARFAASAFALGFATQSVYIDNSTFDGNYADGIAIAGTALFSGQVEQNVGIYGSDVSFNGGNGVSMTGYAYGYDLGYSSYYFPHVAQNLIIGNTSVDDNGLDGVHLDFYAGYGGQINAFTYIFDSHMDGNYRHGVYQTTEANAYSFFGPYALLTNAYADLYVYSSTANNNGRYEAYYDPYTYTTYYYANGGSGIFVTSTAEGPTYLISHIGINDVTAGGNLGSGFVNSATALGVYSLNIQYNQIVDSHFDFNYEDGATISAYQVYGPASFGAAIQNATILDSSFNYNGRSGLVAYASAYDFQGRAELHFQMQGDSFNGNDLDGMAVLLNAADGVYLPGYSCTYVQGLYGGCAFTRSTFTIFDSTFDNNGRDGLYVSNDLYYNAASYTNGGRPLGTPSIISAYNDFSGNDRDGLHVINNVGGYSYLYQYIYDYGSHFDNNGGYGVYIATHLDGGSVALLKDVFVGSSASGNYYGGGYIATTADGSTALQLIGVYDASFSNNYGTGLQIGAGTTSNNPYYPSIVQQYVFVDGSHFDGNSYGGGLIIGSQATGLNAINAQQVEITYSTFDDNASYGFAAQTVAFDAASATLDLSIEDSEANGNGAYGFGVQAIASSLGFVTQNVVFDRSSYYNPYTTTDYYGPGDTANNNGSGGIGVDAQAVNGGLVEQNVGIYYTTTNGNGLNGITLRTLSAGYELGYGVYYSHVTQNVIGYFNTSTGNLGYVDSYYYEQHGGNGVYISNTVANFAQTDSFVYFANATLDNNGYDGLYAYSFVDASNPYYFGQSFLNFDLYVVASSASHNADVGIRVGSYGLEAAYMIQHLNVIDTHADYNGFVGLVAETGATGYYGLNLQYASISDSTFNHNTYAGAGFLAYQNYGPGGFGAAIQRVQVTGSDFSYNGKWGFAAFAEATGEQGRAEQNLILDNSYFNHNGADGVYLSRYAHDGVYTAGCDTAAGGTGTGGCAFIRQTVDFVGSQAAYNGESGIEIYTHADNYGAVYRASGRALGATVLVLDADISNNTGDGITLNNQIDNGSYLFQYLYVADSTINDNGGSGINANNYVAGGSTMVQRLTTYSYAAPMELSGNGGSGLYVHTTAADSGTFAFNRVLSLGTTFDTNYDAGISVTNVGYDAGATSLGALYAYFGTFNGNTAGISGFAYGPSAAQYNYVGYNDITNNFIGIFGRAIGGSFQYWDVHYGNNQSGNFADYFFYADGGSLQIVNY